VDYRSTKYSGTKFVVKYSGTNSEQLISLKRAPEDHGIPFTLLSRVIDVV